MSEIEDIVDWLDSPRWCDGPTQARFKEAADEIRRLRRVSTYDKTRKSIAKVREETLAKAVAERDALRSQVEQQNDILKKNDDRWNTIHDMVAEAREMIRGKIIVYDAAPGLFKMLQDVLYGIRGREALPPSVTSDERA